MSSDDHLQRLQGYSWHQSHDQATVLALIPQSALDEDITVIIKNRTLVVLVAEGLAVIKGTLYGEVLHTSSWLLEPPHLTSTRPHRGRTTSSTSSTSSFTLLSDPEIESTSPSATHARTPDIDENGVGFLSPAFSSPSSVDGDSSSSGSRRRPLPLPSLSSPSSPHFGPRFEPSLSSSASSASASHSSSPYTSRSRLLTIYLEKADPAIWPSLIVGPAPPQYLAALSTTTLSPFSIEEDAGQEAAKYNMDPTSLSLVGADLLVLYHDRDQAFEYLIRAWHQARIPLATMKLVSAYIPLESTPLSVPSLVPQRGTAEFYARCIGGPAAVAQLFLEAGLLYLEGTAPSLLLSSSGVSSLRTQGPFLLAHGGEDLARDAGMAQLYFDRARLFDPDVVIPIAVDSERHELQIPLLDVFGSAMADTTISSSPKSSVPASLSSSRRRRKKENRLSGSEHPLSSERTAWHLFLPGLVGASTALVAVGVVSVVSLSWWRSSQP